MYIYNHKEWPNFTWDSKTIFTLLLKVKNLQGYLLGQMSVLGFDLKNQANLEISTQNILKSSEIEGEFLNIDQVKSSVARHLGLKISGLVSSNENIEGVVEMMLDATEKFDKPLNKKRLLKWHNNLFPRGFSGMYKVLKGQWRDDSTGAMQVISGQTGKEIVHYQAPPADVVEIEMNNFLKWLNSKQEFDLIIKAALAHLWFLTIHPFEDGNGRIARAITDMKLSESDNQSFRFYSMSTQIRKERKAYYNILEKTQKGNLDITDWLTWFLNCLIRSIESSDIILKKVRYKQKFWLENSIKIKNKRQKKVLELLLSTFDGKLTSSKWAKITKCSQDTATRDIQDLIDKKILYKLPEGGRSTTYDLVKIAS